MSAPGIRILGIDPGLRITGFGVIESGPSGLIYVASGRVRSPDAGELPERLAVILQGVREVVAEHVPDRVAIEKVFVNSNAQSSLALGQARGTAICAVLLSRLPIAEYTASQIKKSVVGQGQAGKEQVQEMVRRLLGLPVAPGPDASDALACAICHAYAGQAAGALLGNNARARVAGTRAATPAVGFSMRRGRVTL